MLTYRSIQIKHSKPGRIRHRFYSYRMKKVNRMEDYQ